MNKIYHISDKRNLPQICEHKGLYSKNMARTLNIDSINIAYEGIQDRRAKTKVPIKPGGYLHDYVPFYFAPRSPMLYAIKTGRIEGFEGGQRDIVYLVCGIESIIEKRLPFVFTDGHAIMTFSNYFSDIRHLDRIDWEVMRERYWYDTEENPDRKRKRQAEFLIKEFLPFGLVEEIGVIDASIRNEVRDIVFKNGYDKIVNIKNDWYYF
jgi:hypothetical protein